jgi:hypothetical protein
LHDRVPQTQAQQWFEADLFNSPPRKAGPGIAAASRRATPNAPTAFFENSAHMLFRHEPEKLHQVASIFLP